VATSRIVDNLWVGYSFLPSIHSFLGETERPFLGADLHLLPPGAEAGSRRLRAAGVGVPGMGTGLEVKVLRGASW